MWLLALQSDQLSRFGDDPGRYVDPTTYDPALPLYEPPWWLVWTYGVGWWAYFAFWLWMLVSCIRHDPERYIWLWIIILFPPLGAIIYFLARWLPSRNYQSPQFLRKWTRGREIERLRVAAGQIGNPHQHIELGDALREAGQYDRAAEAYGRALAKDGANLQALWGAAFVDYQQRRFAPCRDKLAKILEKDSAYKFGDVSLLYAKALMALKESEAALQHLEGHTRRWRHPEGLFLLATLYAEAGDAAKAREHLQGLIMDLDGSPRSIARKHFFWKGRAKRLLRRLPG